MSGVLAQLDRELADLSQQVHRSLVRVESGRQGAGAGTIWHPDGLVLTNAHVARRRRHAIQLPDGRRFEARVLARDPELDLAALSVEGAELPTIEIGDSRALRPGNWVMAFGHPWGVAGAATAGVVIGQGAELPEQPETGRWQPETGRWQPETGRWQPEPGRWQPETGRWQPEPGRWLPEFDRGRPESGGWLPELGRGRPQFGRAEPARRREWLAVGLHYRPGHSGGPLVDHAGRLVGINTVMAGPDVGLAIPVHAVKDFLKHAMQRV